MRSMKKKQKSEEKDPNIRSYGIFKNMAYCMREVFKRHPILVLLMPLYAVTASSMSYIWTFFSKVFLDQLTAEVGVEALVITVLIAAGVQLLATGSNELLGTNIWWRYLDTRMEMMNKRIHKTMTMDYQRLENQDMLDIQQKAMQATGGDGNGAQGLMQMTQQSLINIVKVIAAVIIISTLNPLLILAIFALAFLNYITVDLTKKRDKKEVWDKLAPYWRKQGYMEHATTDFSTAKDIRMFSLSGWIIGKYKDLHAVMHGKFVESQNRWIKAGLLNKLIFFVQQGVLYGWLIYEVIANGLSVGDFVLYSGTAATFFATISEVLIQFAEMKNASRQVDDLRTFMEYPQLPVGEKHVPKTGTYEFRFENVSFRYPQAEKYALEGLDLTIKPGQRLAVVGLNGAGKSTMIKLLIGLYRPTEGRITLNGTDITEFDRDEYFSVFAPVFQDVEIFAFPIAENVSMQAPEDTDKAAAEKCLVDAGMEEKLAALPNGVDTELLKVLYDDGVDLSGGEKQKLALARALYKNAPVVVLDEPTAALDALAEYRLYQRFDGMIGGKSAIYISHRLSSTRFCDIIAMFKDGRMCEYGTHSELMEKGGAYAEMFAVQAQYYTEKEAAVNA